MAKMERHFKIDLIIITIEGCGISVVKRDPLGQLSSLTYYATKICHVLAPYLFLQDAL